MPGHVDGGSEPVRLVVQGSEVAALGRAEQLGRDGAAADVEIGGDARPVGRGELDLGLGRSELDPGLGRVQTGASATPSRTPSWASSHCLRSTPPA